MRYIVEHLNRQASMKKAGQESNSESRKKPVPRCGAHGSRVHDSRTAGLLCRVLRGYTRTHLFVAHWRRMVPVQSVVPRVH